MTGELEDTVDGGDGATEPAPAEAEASAPDVDFGPLHDWLSFAFDAVQKPLIPDFLAGLRAIERGPNREPPTPSLTRYSDRFDEVVAHPSLNAWVQSALRYPDVAEQFGATDESTDEASRRLQGECLDLLNDLLLLHHVMGFLPKYDQNLADLEVQDFWSEMRRGVQIFEVGVLLFDFTADATREPVQIGLRTYLRPVTPEWASLRFESSSDIPSNSWVISRTVLLKVDPKNDDFTTFHNRDQFELINEQFSRDGILDVLLERAKLALRLVSPRHYLTSLKYRVHLGGHWQPSYRSHPTGRGWSERSQLLDPVRVSDDEMERIARLGSIISDLTRQHDWYDDEGTDLLGVTVRSFMSSFQRDRWDDRVVDLAVALEALFARATVEITNRAATRAALLLGKSPDDSDRILKTTQAFYNLRSAIVHADPERRDGGVKSTVGVWRRGGSFRLPASGSARGSEAATVGAELISQALSAYLRLALDEGLDPFALRTKRSAFVEKLDQLAFDSDERRRLQIAAGVLPTPITDPPSPATASPSAE